MKTTRKIAQAAISILVMICLCGSGETAFGQVAPGLLKHRAIRPKPSRTIVDTAKARADVVVVKFKEGTRVRERLGQFQADLTNLSDADERLLQRVSLPRQRIFQGLAQINAAVAPNSRRHITRLFTRSEAVLDAEKRDGEARTGEELADLNLYNLILIENASPAGTERLIDQLNALDIVEAAYAQPIAQDAQTDRAPTTSDMSFQQGYLNAAANGTNGSNGIDAVYARSFPGARGNDVNIIDIERGWNLVHEDLPPVFFQAGPNLGHPSRQHGTAVLGILAAGENGYGMTGIAPQSRIGVSSAVRNVCVPVTGICWLVDDFENSVNRSAAALRPGDIMLIEQHAPGPDSGLSPLCNDDQFEFIAMEFWDANFDAIKNATSKGVVVVEAAGNGGMDLDSPIYSGKFDRTVRDSGAIVVGAGSSAGRAPLCFTNFGARVDVQAWGQNVATLGAADADDPEGTYVNGNDDTQWYRTDFSGTSSASAIITGVASSLQGFRKARGLGTFGSVQMRSFLRKTGMAQAADPRQIGPLPNLRAAIEGTVTSVQSRPVKMIRFFPTGTNFSSSPFFFGGSKTFTDRSTDAQGFFEVTYRVEVVTSIYAPFSSQVP